MSRLLPERTRRRPVLGVDREHLVWLQDGGGPATGVADWSHRTGSVQEVGESLRGLGAGPLDVIAGNDLALHWVQTPPASVASFSELRLVAQARCAHLYGGSPEDWRIAADWQSGRPFVCAALPEGVLTPIEQQLAEYGLVARWHSAWEVVTSGMSQAFPSDGWSAVRSPARVVLWHCRSARVDCMATWPVNAQESTISAVARASQQVQVEISRAGHEDDGDLHWLDLVTAGDEPADLRDVVAMRRPDLRLPAGCSTASTEAAAALGLSGLIGGTRK